jgi:hypothetical protein
MKNKIHASFQRISSHILFLIDTLKMIHIYGAPCDISIHVFIVYCSNQGEHIFFLKKFIISLGKNSISFPLAFLRYTAHHHLKSPCYAIEQQNLFLLYNCNLVHIDKSFHSPYSPQPLVSTILLSTSMRSTFLDMSDCVVFVFLGLVYFT